MKRHGSKASAPAERGANSSMRHELLKRERGAKVSGAASRTFGGPPPGRAVAVGGRADSDDYIDYYVQHHESRVAAVVGEG